MSSDSEVLLLLGKIDGKLDGLQTALEDHVAQDTRRFETSFAKIDGLAEDVNQAKGAKAALLWVAGGIASLSGAAAAMAASIGGTRMSTDFRAGLIAGILVTLAFIAAIGMWCGAKACDWITTVNVSYHYYGNYDAGAHHNLMNWGLGCEKMLTERTRLTVGGYDNSYRETSIYLGAAWTPIEFVNFHLGLMAAAVTGYQTDRRNPSPVASPVLMYEGQRYGVNIAWLVAPTSNRGVIAAQFKFRWQ